MKKYVIRCYYGGMLSRIEVSSLQFEYCWFPEVHVLEVWSPVLQRWGVEPLHGTAQCAVIVSEAPFQNEATLSSVKGPDLVESNSLPRE